MQPRWRNRLRAGALLVALAMGPAAAGEGPRADLQAYPLAAAVLARDTIDVHAEGTAPVPFAQALAMLDRPDLLDAVQAAYTGMLPAGERPEFEVQTTGPGRYHYVNRSNQRSDITELLRGATADGASVLAFHVSGQRFFGAFESVLRVEARSTADGLTRYKVDVYAYPVSTVPRFLARHLRLVERYFHGKTRDMIPLVTRICTELCAAEEPVGPAVTQNATPSGHVP
jgi:hypothetical protein